MAYRNTDYGGPVWLPEPNRRLPMADLTKRPAREGTSTDPRLGPGMAAADLPASAMAPQAFDNGLGVDGELALDAALAKVRELTVIVSNLGRHRSYSLAITKLDEAGHWLLDRKTQTA